MIWARVQFAGGGKQTAADAAATLLIPFSLAQATAFA